jgi:hypothetical protein
MECAATIGSVHDAELQVRSGDLENKILAVLDQRPPIISIPVRATDSLEFDIYLEAGTVAADKRALQSRGQSAFGREDLVKGLSGQPWQDCLHPL